MGNSIIPGRPGGSVDEREGRATANIVLAVAAVRIEALSETEGDRG